MVVVASRSRGIDRNTRHLIGMSTANGLAVAPVRPNLTGGGSMNGQPSKGHVGQMSKITTIVVPSVSPGGAAARLVAIFALCLAVGAVAGAVTVPEVRGWYQGIAKPWFTPPDRVFGPVWSTLYPMMALAGWMAWRRDRFAWSSAALRLFLLQLALNFAWSFLFFSFHWLLGASVEAALLWASILATTREFLKRDRWAGILMIPYLLWVSLASVLTWTIWAMNF